MKGWKEGEGERRRRRYLQKGRRRGILEAPAKTRSLSKPRCEQGPGRKEAGEGRPGSWTPAGGRAGAAGVAGGLGAGAWYFLRPFRKCSGPPLGGIGGGMGLGGIHRLLPCAALDSLARCLCGPSSPSRRRCSSPISRRKKPRLREGHRGHSLSLLHSSAAAPAPARSLHVPGPCQGCGSRRNPGPGSLWQGQGGGLGDGAGRRGGARRIPRTDRAARTAPALRESSAGCPARDRPPLPRPGHGQAGPRDTSDAPPHTRDPETLTVHLTTRSLLR